MHQKELRLAIVCYGGVSLAIYMHGVVKEILKLARASQAYHGISDRRSRADATYDQASPARPGVIDTERFYFEFLQACAERQELRVIVDAVSGASAGGINGIFLARALAHDLCIDHQRKMWIELADVTYLMDKEAIADRWSKFYLYPFLMALNWRRLRRLFPDDEMRRKISTFVRSRWFEPPFSGRIMQELMLDAIERMGDIVPGHSLLPRGHALDLVVSLTNFHGRQQAISIHDPAQVIEREHRASLSFGYVQHQDGSVSSDFERDDIPGIAFAARATSSVPGTFPPARIVDLEPVLAARRRDWPDRQHFLLRNFPNLIARGIDPAEVSFIDGGVVNNKPFGGVIETLQARPAHREVDRRILFIDPTPEKVGADSALPKPGFFRAIFASLAEIPRNEPIRDELEWVDGHNRRASRLHSVVAAARTEIEPVIDSLIADGGTRRASAALLATWREQANALSDERAGYAYATYFRLKSFYLFEGLSAQIVNLAQRAGLDLDLAAIQGRVLHWARIAHLWSDEDGATETRVDRDALVAGLRRLDVDYRIRRLRFVVMCLNQMYGPAKQGALHAGRSVAIDAIKKDFNGFLGQLADRKAGPTDTAGLGAMWQALGADDPEAATQAVEGLIARLGDHMGLEDIDYDLDEVLANWLNAQDDAEVRQCVLRSYIGFPFYDTVTLPLTQSTDLIELEPVLVDRISPEESSSIRDYRTEPMLRGSRFYKYGAFFSQKDRENDYLWGRLHASERLVDLLIDSVGAANLAPSFDVRAFKQRMFRAILDSEAPHLPNSGELVDTLRGEIDAMGED